VYLPGDDPVVDVVHPVAAGPVTIVSLAVVPLLRRVLLMIIVFSAGVMRIILSPAVVLSILRASSMVVPFMAEGAAVMVTLAAGASGTVGDILLRRAVVVMINRWPLNTHGMVMPSRHPMTRDPDMSGVLRTVVAFDPDIISA
jgi:hypothetical protein